MEMFIDQLLAANAQLKKDKDKLLKENRKLQSIIKNYDPFIVERIIEGKDEKLNEYREIRNKI